jgi:hypothetical protein
MNYFKTLPFSLEKFMDVEQHRTEYIRQLRKNPLFERTFVCGSLNNAVLDCDQRKGEDDEECQELRLQSIACVASVLVPDYFERWRSCLEANNEKDDPLFVCDKEGTAAIMQSSNKL